MDHRSLIAGADLLLDAFGGWPDFRDAEVVRLALDRDGTQWGGPTLEAWIHLYETTGDAGTGNAFTAWKHALAHLAFHGVVSLGMGGWGERNALFGLRIADAREHRLEGIDFEVEFVGSHGVNAGFGCRRVEIRSVEPCAPDGKRLRDLEAC
jgi:hypothetical protein